MNTVVNKLLDVDKQARMILDEAQQYYDRTLADIEAEKKRLRAEYEKKAETHFADIKNVEENSATEAAAEIKNKYAGLTADMDKIFDEKHLEWEDEIYRKCIGR